MATKIFDIDMSGATAPAEGLAGYDHALILLRSGPQPVDKITLPVTDGAINPRSFARSIPDAALAYAAAAALQHRLAPLTAAAPATSIAICTRERPDDLRRALDALTNPPQGAEIIVVDNCPATDATRSVVADYPAVHYVLEPNKGLDNARNRALREAQFDIVAFIDDDAVADPNWANAIARPFADERVACVTGLTMPYELENDAQEKFETLAGFSKRGFYRRSFRAPPLNPLATGAIGAGANMAIRRSVVEQIGYFDPALDAGTATQSGGDHEYFTRILLAGLMITYEPAALNWHRHRRTWEELLKAIHGYGVGVYACWTRSFLTERQWGVFRRGAGWLIYEQLPELAKSILRPTPEKPAAVVWAELRGCARGPFAYLKARKLAREAGHE